MEQEIALRVTVLGIPAGVAFAMQRGKFELLPPSHATADTLAFEFKVRIAERKDGGAPNVLGPYAHGKPDDRFLYLNSGTSVGQLGSPWTRRAKIKTGGISWKLVAALRTRPGAVLEARIGGRAKDGGPCCATVPLLEGGWNVAGP
ncbi:MAG TPA: DUF5990 family protein [Steroidobacteraceae bacterium]|nr:DUF5990 family protein [Steroidobacteraceae bacterium]